LTEEAKILDRIRSLASQLPDCILRKADVSGDSVDLEELFETNVGTTSSMTRKNRRRTERCIQVLESLISAETSNLASKFWVQIFDVVNEELQLAHSILVEAESLTPEEWSEILAPVSVMVKGVAECIRVARSIVASIGDVLLLDESTVLTSETWGSTWSSLSILEKAIDCENKWKEIQSLVNKSPLGVADTASIREIREDANSRKFGARKTVTAFCHLTLQPLREENEATTKAKVLFHGKCFMACSANILANRCPSFAAGEKQ